MKQRSTARVRSFVEQVSQATGYVNPEKPSIYPLADAHAFREYGRVAGADHQGYSRQESMS